jgi:NADH-quinone oxidoreductase subunit J
MSWVFYASGIIAIICAAMVLTRSNAMHALIYLILVLMSTAAIFASLGASLIAVLQIIIYAGAIMVLFVFIVMMLNMGSPGDQRERGWMRGKYLIPPIVLAAVLLVLFAYAVGGREAATAGTPIGPKAVGISLFSDYFIGVEVASLLLLAALVGAFHLGYLRKRVAPDAE